jgi:hypothetical protein
MIAMTRPMIIIMSAEMEVKGTVILRRKTFVGSGLSLEQNHFLIMQIQFFYFLRERESGEGMMKSAEKEQKQIQFDQISVIFLLAT